MNEYINVDEMYKELFNILKGERDSFKGEEEYSLICDIIDDNYLEDRSFEMAYDFNSSMKEYLHMKDHKICGNFNNIEYDYIKFRTGDYGYDSKMLQDMIKRLDDNDQSEQSKSDRSFLVSWFFSTFGAYGIAYNFGDEIYSALEDYKYEKEMTDA